MPDITLTGAAQESRTSRPAHSSAAPRRTAAGTVPRVVPLWQATAPSFTHTPAKGLS